MESYSSAILVFLKTWILNLLPEHTMSIFKNQLSLSWIFNWYSGIGSSIGYFLIRFNLIDEIV